MGRKDASAFNSQPVEQYRKQIGKQDWKKSRHAIKSMKKSDHGSDATPQQIVIMIALVVVAMAGFYALLLWYLEDGISKGHRRPDVPVT